MAWDDFGNTFPAPATVANPLLYRELGKLWFALRERGRVTGPGTPWDQWPPTGMHYFDGYAASTVSSGGYPAQVRCRNADNSTYPAWPDLYWNSSAGVDDRPSQFDVVFDSDVPWGVYRAGIANVKPPFPGDTLLLDAGVGDASADLWNGRITILGRGYAPTGYAMWWSERWWKWPTLADPKGGTLAWYTGLTGEVQYASVEAATGNVVVAGFPNVTVTFQEPTGEDGACEPNTHPIFDVDLYTGTFNVNPCDPDRYPSPDFYKSLRGLQADAHAMCGYFVRDRGAGGYDGWAYYAIPSLTAAEWYQSAGINGWTATTGTPAAGKLPVGGSGVTMPDDWTVDATHPRTVHYAIISTGAPLPYNRIQSGGILSVGTALYDGANIYSPSDGADFNENVYAAGSPVGKRFEGQTVYVSFGFTRTVKRQFRYLYAREIWVPDLDDEGAVVDPPTLAHPGTWVVRPASTRCSKYEPYGIVLDDADAAFTAGMRARYKGDVQGEANVRSWPIDAPVAWDALDPDPRLSYYARFPTFWRTAPGQYTPQPDQTVVASGTVTTGGAGTMTDATQHWDSAWERQKWKGRSLRFIDTDNVAHDAGIISNSADHVLTYPAGVTSVIGWRYEVLEWQPGAILEWDGAKWVKPATLRTGETALPVDVQCIEPDQVKRFGFTMTEDVFPGTVLAEMKAGINKLVAQKRPVSWKANLPGGNAYNEKSVVALADLSFEYGATLATDWENHVRDGDPDTLGAVTWWALSNGGTPPAPGDSDLASNPSDGRFLIITTADHSQADGAPLSNFAAPEMDGTLQEADAAYRYAYGRATGLPTIVASTAEFLNFGAADVEDHDVGTTWNPPQVDADATNLANYTHVASVGDDYYGRKASTITYAPNGLQINYRTWKQWGTASGSTAERYSSIVGSASLPQPPICTTPTDDIVWVTGTDAYDYSADQSRPHRETQITQYKGAAVINVLAIVRFDFEYHG